MPYLYHFRIFGKIPHISPINVQSSWQARRHNRDCGRLVDHTDGQTQGEKNIFKHFENLERPPQVAWRSPILSWPRIVFSKCKYHDFFKSRHKIECFEPSSSQRECFLFMNRAFGIIYFKFWFDIFHLFHVLCALLNLQTYSMFSNSGWQDSSIYGALSLWSPESINQKMTKGAKLSFLLRSPAISFWPAATWSLPHWIPYFDWRYHQSWHWDALADRHLYQIWHWNWHWLILAGSNMVSSSLNS